MIFVQTAEIDLFAMATKMLNLHTRKKKKKKKKSKINSSEAIRGMKLKFWRNIHFIAVAHVLSSLWLPKISSHQKQ